MNTLTHNSFNPAKLKKPRRSDRTRCTAALSCLDMAAPSSSGGVDMAFLADIKGFDGKGTLKRVGTTVTTASGRRVRWEELWAWSLLYVCLCTLYIVDCSLKRCEQTLVML